MMKNRWSVSCPGVLTIANQNNLGTDEGGRARCFAPDRGQWHYPHYSNQGGSPHGAVRLGDYKLIEWYEDMHVELYDLKNDLGELHDLAKENSAKAAELTKLLHDWRATVAAQMPTPNPNYNPDAKNPGQKKAGNTE